MKNTLRVLSLAPITAAAHDGHGIAGSAHWHATDALGFVIALVVVAAAIWWRGGK